MMVIKTRKAKAPTDTGRMVLALQSMAATEGWAIIVRICDSNIDYLERAIISKCDPQTKRVLSDFEVDQLRAKHDYLVELRDTPANYAKQLSMESIAPENFDPYFKTAEDIIEERRMKAGT